MGRKNNKRKLVDMVEEELATYTQQYKKECYGIKKEIPFIWTSLKQVGIAAGSCAGIAAAFSFLPFYLGSVISGGSTFDHMGIALISGTYIGSGVAACVGIKDYFDRQRDKKMQLEENLEKIVLERKKSYEELKDFDFSRALPHIISSGEKYGLITEDEKFKEVVNFLKEFHKDNSVQEYLSKYETLSVYRLKEIYDIYFTKPKIGVRIHSGRGSEIPLDFYNLDDIEKKAVVERVSFSEPFDLYIKDILLDELETYAFPDLDKFKQRIYQKFVNKSKGEERMRSDERKRYVTDMRGHIGM